MEKGLPWEGFFVRGVNEALIENGKMNLDKLRFE